MALDHLALDLKTNEQEEQGHQAVVDPEQQWFGDLQCADLNGDRHFQQAVVQKRQRRVVDDQGENGRGDQQQAAGGFELKETGKEATHGQWAPQNGCK
ncbi:hypothetical protein D3C80_1504770 [compost metagenome]